MISESSSPMNPIDPDESDAESTSSSSWWDGITNRFNLSNLPWLEIFFLYYMIIAGIVAMAVSYKIDYLASNCGETATSMGLVFLTEAIGGVVGGITSVYLYHMYSGNWILIVVGIALGCTLIAMPFITSIVLMNVAYFLVGGFLLNIQIGCIHLVRWIQRDTAGHWLGLTQAALSGGSAFVLVTDWGFRLTTKWEFITFACLVWSISVSFIAVPFTAEDVRNRLLRMKQQQALTEEIEEARRPVRSSSKPQLHNDNESTTLTNSSTPTSSGRHFNYNTTSPLISSPRTPPTLETVMQQQQQQHEHQQSAPLNTSNVESELSVFDTIFIAPHYHVEILVGCAAGLINGCGLMMSSYLSTYVTETKVETYNLVKYQLTLFWATVTIGRVVGTADQYFFVTDDNLLWHTMVWIVFSTLKTVVWLVLWEEERGIWIVALLLGFCFGPLIGYVIDWVHRLTTPSEASTTILMLVSFVVSHAMMYFCSVIWEAGGGPRTLIVMIMISLLLIIPMIWIGKYVSYFSDGYKEYTPVPTAEL